VKYFFRLDYTSGVQSVPLCAVHWIDFTVVKDTINCVIGQIPMQSWNEIRPHPLAVLRNMPFISFNDLQPSRYALSYIPNLNQRSYWMEVAFLALDSEKLGEHVEDAYYLDFGDNMFPLYKANRKTKSVFEEEDGSDEEDLQEQENILRRNTLTNLKEYIPKSIVDFILE
jgi:hypothetical protein